MSQPAVCHPLPERLRAFCVGTITLEEQAQIAHHLESCTQCCDLLESRDEPIFSRLLARPHQPHDTPADLHRPDTQESLPAIGKLGEATVAQLVARFHPPAAPDELGRLGTYRVLSLLGQGGMGAVFLAEDPRLQRSVALKVMLPGLADQPAARERFLREARVAASLTDDHIVPIYEVDEDAGIPFIAMPRLLGCSLDERLKRGPAVTVQEILCIARGVAHGLAAAHEHGLIHRDIKPGNIWLETDPDAKSAPQVRVKLLDFGLARALVGQESLTHPGLLIGTPAFMAPEQARGQGADCRADLFSLGVVLYCLCTGRLPFPGTEPVQVLMSLALVEPKEPAALNQAIPAPLSALIMDLLEKEPQKRLASARLVLERLARIEQEIRAPATFGQAALKSLRQRWRARPRWLVPVGSAVLGLVLAAAVGLVLRVETPEGTLVLNILDPNLMVSVHDGKATVHEKSTDRTFSLRMRKGEIHVFDRAGKNLLVTKEFQMRSGERVTLEVTREELLAARTRLVEAQPWKNEWTSLFNGKDLAGWKYHPLLPGDWRVENGTLIGTGRKGWLFSDRGDLGDFHLRAEVRINQAGDSGIFFWTTFSLNPQNDPEEWHEVQIKEGPGLFGSGSLDGQGRHAPGKPAPSRADEWFVLEVLAVGNKVSTKVNGVPQSFLAYAAARQGHLALQVYGPNTVVEFRKIEVRELATKKP